MKKVYKRIIAAALCLALMAALVPATVFADDDNWFSLPEDQWINEDQWKDRHFWPGQLRLYLKGLFLGDITELFPELDIEKYELRGRCPIEQQMDNPYYLARKSTTYYVELREKTREAVLEALEVLKDNPYLFAARPVWGGIVPGDLLVSLKEQYYNVDDEVYGDLADILPEIEIESYRDQYLCVLTDEQRLTVSQRNPDYAARIGTTFHVMLTEKTEEASLAAVEALKDNPYIKYAELNYYAYFDEVDWSSDFSVADALRVLRVAAGLAEADPEIAAAFYDKDGDGEVTVADALIVLRIAAKLA